MLLKRLREPDKKPFFPEAIKTVIRNGSDRVTLRMRAVLLPVERAEKHGIDFHGGLVDADEKELVPGAVLLRHGKVAQALSDAHRIVVETDGLPEARGTFFYGGLLSNNFGHFLLESIGRLWAYSSVQQFDPFIIFHTPWGVPDLKQKNNYVHQVLKGFGIPVNRLVFFPTATRLETVIIPELKYGFGKCRFPDQTFMGFIDSFAPHWSRKAIRPAAKLYVSRSRLPFNHGRPIGERQFEEYLRTEGYLVIYPEQMTSYEQLSLYQSAEWIVFCDGGGGATYATVLLPKLRAKIATVARRRDPRWNYEELTEHFRGYRQSVLWIDEVMGQYQFGLESWDAVAEIHWRKVSLALQAAGFVEFAFEGWEAERQADLKRQEIEQYIRSIQANPLFVDYMLKQSEKYPVLPTSFQTP